MDPVADFLTDTIPSHALRAHKQDNQSASSRSRQLPKLVGKIACYGPTAGWSRFDLGDATQKQTLSVDSMILSIGLHLEGLKLFFVPYL